MLQTLACRLGLGSAHDSIALAADVGCENADFGIRSITSGVASVVRRLVRHTKREDDFADFPVMDEGPDVVPIIQL